MLVFFQKNPSTEATEHCKQRTLTLNKDIYWGCQDFLEKSLLKCLTSFYLTLHRSCGGSQVLDTYYTFHSRISRSHKLKDLFVFCMGLWFSLMQRAESTIIHLLDGNSTFQLRHIEVICMGNLRSYLLLLQCLSFEHIVTLLLHEANLISHNQLVYLGSSTKCVSWKISVLCCLC